MFMSLMLQAVYVMRWIKMAKVPLHTAGQEVGNRENGQELLTVYTYGVKIFQKTVQMGTFITENLGFVV